jgi:hypothetical protein
VDVGRWPYKIKCLKERFKDEEKDCKQFYGAGGM